MLTKFNLQAPSFRPHQISQKSVQLNFQHLFFELRRLFEVKALIVRWQMQCHTQFMHFKPIRQLIRQLRLLGFKGLQLIQALQLRLQFPTNWLECRLKQLNWQHSLLKMPQWMFGKSLLLAQRQLAKRLGNSKKLLRSNKTGLLKYKNSKSLCSSALSCNPQSLD